MAFTHVSENTNPYYHKAAFATPAPYASPDFDYPEAETFPEINLALPEEALRYLRDFILGSAAYVEELEAAVCDTSDEYWEAREHAYRIITGLLIDLYQYEMEG